MKLKEQFPVIIKDAIDFVLDTVRTGRTRIRELDKVEKTFIGLKIEHFIRDWLDVPKGRKRDLSIDGIDVDVKHTVGATWMIPVEIYRGKEPCLLVATAEPEGRCSSGLILAKPEYLSSSANQDQKRSISEAGRRNILWILKDEPFPPSPWDGVDVAKFRELRRLDPGTARAVEFFKSTLDKKIHRSVIQALLHDQKDYMKRLRENQGARGVLAKQGILLLSGAFDREEALRYGHDLAPDEFVSVRQVP